MRQSHSHHLPSDLHWPSHLLLYWHLQSWQAVQMKLCLCTTFLVEHNLDKAGALLALLAVQ